MVADGSAGLAGGAYLFAKTASGWKLAADLNATNANLVASSVAITATRVLIGDTPACSYSTPQTENEEITLFGTAGKSCRTARSPTADATRRLSGPDRL